MWYLVAGYMILSLIAILVSFKYAREDSAEQTTEVKSDESK